MEFVSGFDELFRIEYPRLVRALSVAYDADTAAEAVQEAFIEADQRWRRISRYEDPVGWVRRVAINRARNAVRDHNRRRDILSTVAIPPVDNLTDSLLDLQAAIDALPDQQRLTVCLFYLADLSIEAISQGLEVSTGTVKSNLHDARLQLRILLEEKHG